MPSLRDMPIEELRKALKATLKDAPQSLSARILERELRRRLSPAERKRKGGKQ